MIRVRVSGWETRARLDGSPVKFAVVDVVDENHCIIGTDCAYVTYEEWLKNEGNIEALLALVTAKITMAIEIALDNAKARYAAP